MPLPWWRLLWDMAHNRAHWWSRIRNNGEGQASTSAPGRKFKRWHIAVLAFIAALTAFFILFDWNWLRGPLERYVTDKTQREFTIASLDVELGLTPTVILEQVRFANADWSDEKAPMARIGKLSFSVSLRDLWDQKILVPRAALTNAHLIFEKAKDGRKNWVLKEPDAAREPGSLRIGSISVDTGSLHYVDHGEPFAVDINVNTFTPEARQKATDADAKPDNRVFATQYVFAGTYHEAPFKGEARTGEVLSFQESGIAFPIQGSLDANTTRIKVDGTVADLADISGIDVALTIEGDTLASLYPFLLLPLPASPPYAFQGRLMKEGNRFTIDDLAGKIGSTDVRGGGAYVDKEPRPLLTAKLQSRLLNIADLGPVIGLETKGTKATPTGARPKAADTSTRDQAKAKERATAGKKILPSGTTAAKGDGILPTGKFEGGKLRAIDADVTYSAAALKAPTGLPVENMRFKFSLHDAVAKLEPLQFGFAGGSIVAQVTLDAREEKSLRSDLQVDFRGLKVAQLVPDSPRLANGAGTIGAQVRLRGTGDSIADAAASANGDLAAAIAGGRISNLVDAAAGLNGGKILALLTGGDKEIAVRCGAFAFDVKNGHGNSRVMAMDTEQTMVEGTGAFTLKNERFDVRIQARPKSPGILSFRTPIHAWGSFREPEFELEKAPLLARGGAAVLLATAVNPFAAVLALIEPGTKEDGDCQQSSKAIGGAYAQATQRSAGKR